jgi:transmembrane sensor
MSGRPTAVPPDRDEEAARWCLRLSESTPLGAEEEAGLVAYLADPENAAAFQEQVRLWGLIEFVAGQPEMIRLRADALGSYRAAQAARWAEPSTLRHRNHLFAAAAAVVLLVASVIALLYDPATIYRTAQGERRVVVLADGSRLSLDADTQVKVQLGDDRRDLWVERGRAKFDVARNPFRPFVVTAGERRIVATGTAFSVELVGSKLSVLLYEGRVLVFDASSGDRGRSVALNAGTMLTASAGMRTSAVTRPIVGTQSLAWEGGQLNFTREPLADALVRVNRYAVSPIKIGDATTAAIRISGVFNAGDTEAFLEAVTMVNNLKVVRKSDHVLLTRS